MFLAKYREEKISFDSGEGHSTNSLRAMLCFQARQKLPLLRIKSCTIRGANGNCGVSTFLFAYDRKAERFRVVFFNMMGRNNNQETGLLRTAPCSGV